MTATSSRPVPNRDNRLLLGGACSLIFLAMVTNFAPTPLYPLYQQAWGISDVQVSLAFATYPVGVITVLLLFGGLSDRIGRRSTLLVAIGLLSVALLTLALAPAYPVLLLGRLIQGFGTGLATGAAAAALMESHPRGLAAGAFTNTMCLAVGMATGPLLSGALAGVTDHPRVVPFIVIAVALLVPASLLLRTTRDPRSSTPTRLVQPIGVPRELWFPFTISAAAIISANGGLGVFGSFGTEIGGTIGWESQARVGWLVSGTLMMLAVAQIGMRSFAPTTTMIIGSLCAPAGWLITAWGAHVGAAPLVVIGSLLIGTAAGMCLLSAAAYVGVISPPHRRGEVYSAFLVIAFSTLGLTALGAGPVIENMSTQAVLWGSAAIAGLLAAWVAPVALRLSR